MKNFDFFPLGRALSLENEEDSKDVKLDLLQAQVNFVVAKLKEQVKTGFYFFETKFVTKIMNKKMFPTKKVTKDHISYLYFEIPIVSKDRR